MEKLAETDLDTLQELLFRAKNGKTSKSVKRNSVDHLLSLGLIDFRDNGIYKIYRPTRKGLEVLEERKKLN